MGEWQRVGPAGNRAYLAVPAGSTGPGVLVLHAWWGLTPVLTDVCDRLAAAGFVALAPSLYPGGATAATIAEAEALRDGWDEEAEVEPVVLAATDMLRGLPAATGAPIGVVGFSMGAYWALHLSRVRPDDVAAVVAVYGTDDGDYGTARAAYLGHFAEHDDYEPPEAVGALETRIRAAGREVTFHVYPGTGHWFVEPNRPEYDATAADLVWDRTLTFLKEQLAGTSTDGDRMDLLDRLLEHDRWATTTLLDLTRPLPDAQLDQPFDVGHRTLRETFHHAIFNVEFWTGLMTEQPVGAEPDAGSIATLIDHHERSHAAFATFARRIRDEHRLDDTFVDHYGYPMTFGGAILHVLLHDAEHRSEALHILARLGVPDLPEVDHGLWDFKRRGF
ncbi:MAG TPA: DinB family protein [Thermomicrobiales bacterium]|jgi:carboxymethylenebutenolidase